MLLLIANFEDNVNDTSYLIVLLLLIANDEDNDGVYPVYYDTDDGDTVVVNDRGRLAK